MTAKPGKPEAMSRRHFVTLVAAGSAALLAHPVDAAVPVRGHGKQAVKPATPGMSTATSKELARQRASTLDTLKTIRNHVMPAGTELGFVFRASRPAKRER